ncbi:MAG: hypothetical protein OXC37_02465 [Bdellovibrionaceae bacterium]|nr:hypothetical protein [Pseudobdellovibrionaceae bacterium]
MIVSIGFYISKDSLNVAELSFSDKGPEILSANNLFFKDPESEEEKHILLSKEIKRIEEQYKGKNIRLCYAISQSLVSSFFVEFPFKEKFKILKTLPFEVEDKTPFQSDKVYFDARICRLLDNKSSVLVFVTPEENIKEFVTFTKPLKRNIHLLSCSSSALANLLETWNVPLSKAQNLNKGELFVYLGVENSLALFYKEGFLNHVFVLNWGCHGIIEEMQKSYKLTIEKAYEEFFSKAFVLTQVKGFTKEQVFFSNLIKKHIKTLAPELKLFKVSLETQLSESFSKIVIFGRGSMIQNLSSVLTEELDLPVSKLKKFSPFPNFDLQQKPLSDIALGLALEGLKKSPYTGLNFLQSTKKSSFFLYPKKWKKTILVSLFCFVIFSIYAFIRQFESSLLSQKIDEVFKSYGQKIAYLKPSSISIESLENFLSAKKEEKEDEKIVKEELEFKQPIDYLEQIVQKTGPAEQWGLRLQYLKIRDRKVEMRGLIEKSSLEKFKKLLQSLSFEKTFKETKVSLSEKTLNEIKAEQEIKDKEKINLEEQIKSSSEDSSESTDKDLNKLSSFSYSLILKEEL